MLDCCFILGVEGNSVTTAAMLAGNLKKMKKVTCGHRIPAPVSGKHNRKNGHFRFPDGHKVPSYTKGEDRC